MDKIKVLVVGAGGFGEFYVSELLTNNRYADCQIAGIVDPFFATNKWFIEAKQKNIPVFSTMDEFYEDNKADLAVISTPIHFHTQQILTALKNNSNVLCEKPICADENDIEKIIKMRNESQKFVFIGFQWSFNESIRELKRDLIKGIYGKVESIKSMVLWPRNADYFKRTTGWAGKITSAEGKAIFDSVASNATAHYLHNMMFLLGESMNFSMLPTKIEGRLKRVYDIENFDTCDIRLCFSSCVVGRYFASHGTDIVVDPIFDIKCSNGSIHFRKSSTNLEMFTPINLMTGNIFGVFADGRIKNYGNPDEDNFIKLRIAVDCINMKKNPNDYCIPETVIAHTKVINYLQKNIDIVNANEKDCQCREKGFKYEKGLGKKMIEEYNKAF